jgi:hypothetical protein
MMSEELEQYIDSHFEGELELEDNKFLMFRKISEHRGTDRHAVEVFLDDRTLGTTIKFATYFDAAWKFTSPMNENLFWKCMKSKREEMKEVFSRVNSRMSSKEAVAVRVRISRFRTSASSKIAELKKIFTGEVQDDNA